MSEQGTFNIRKTEDLPQNSSQLTRSVNLSGDLYMGNPTEGQYLRLRVINVTPSYIAIMAHEKVDEEENIIGRKNMEIGSVYNLLGTHLFISCTPTTRMDGRPQAQFLLTAPDNVVILTGGHLRTIEENSDYQPPSTVGSNFSLVKEKGYVPKETENAERDVSRHGSMYIGNPAEGQYTRFRVDHTSSERIVLTIFEKIEDEEILLGTTALENDSIYRLEGTQLRIRCTEKISDFGAPRARFWVSAPANVDFADNKQFANFK